MVSVKVAAFLDLEGPFDLDGYLSVFRVRNRLGLDSAQLTPHKHTKWSFPIPVAMSLNGSA